MVHQRRLGAAGEDIDVAARLAPAAQAADRRELRARRMFAQVGDQLRRNRRGVGQQMASAIFLPLLDGLEDQRFLFRPHAFQRSQPARFRRFDQFIDAADVE